MMTETEHKDYSLKRAVIETPRFHSGNYDGISIHIPDKIRRYMRISTNSWGKFQVIIVRKDILPEKQEDFEIWKIQMRKELEE